MGDVGDAVAGPNSPGEPIVLAAHYSPRALSSADAAAFWAGRVRVTRRLGSRTWLSSARRRPLSARVKVMEASSHPICVEASRDALREDSSRPRVLGPSTRRINNSTTRVEAV